MKKAIPTICFLILSLIVSGCGPGGLFGPTMTPIPTITPTSTSTPVPTSTPTPLPSIITNEVCTWTLNSVTLSDSSIYATQSGIRLHEGFLFLTIEFDNTEGCSLAGVAFGGDGHDAVFEKATMLSGIPTIYVIDRQGNQFFAVEVGENYILAGVKKESIGFTLYVSDMAPLFLGK